MKRTLNAFLALCAGALGTHANAQSLHWRNYTPSGFYETKSIDWDNNNDTPIIGGTGFNANLFSDKGLIIIQDHCGGIISQGSIGSGFQNDRFEDVALTQNALLAVGATQRAIGSGSGQAWATSIQPGTPLTVNASIKANVESAFYDSEEETGYGNSIIAGRVGNSTNSQILLTSVDPSMAVAWSKVYGSGTNPNQAENIIYTTNREMAVCGIYNGPGLSAGGQHIFILIVDPLTGNIVPNSAAIPNFVAIGDSNAIRLSHPDICEIPGEGYAVVAMIDIASGRDLLLIKTDYDLNITYNQAFNIDEHDVNPEILYDPINEFLVIHATHQPYSTGITYPLALTIENPTMSLVLNRTGRYMHTSSDSREAVDTDYISFAKYLMAVQVSNPSTGLQLGYGFLTYVGDNDCPFDPIEPTTWVPPLVTNYPPLDNPGPSFASTPDNVYTTSFVDDKVCGEKCKRGSSQPLPGEEEEMPFMANLYPNPSNGQFTLGLDLKQGENFQISVYDHLGKMVFSTSKSCTAGKNSIDFNLASLPSGTYFMNVEGSESSQLKIFTIQQ